MAYLNDPVGLLASALLACLEGTRLKAYQDSGGRWTLGIGHTLNVHEGDICSLDQALAMLQNDEQKLFNLVKTYPVLEAVAYVSFGFNCGLGALEKVLTGADKISNPSHIHDQHGNILAGLQTRRNLELALIAVSRSINAQLEPNTTT